MMIPKRCANCEHAGLLSDDASQPVPALCKLEPEWVFVGEARAHECSHFEMADPPRWTVPDAPQEADGAAPQVE